MVAIFLEKDNVFFLFLQLQILLFKYLILNHQ